MWLILTSEAEKLSYHRKGSNFKTVSPQDTQALDLVTCPEYTEILQESKLGETEGVVTADSNGKDLTDFIQ